MHFAWGFPFIVTVNAVCVLNNVAVFFKREYTYKCIASINTTFFWIGSTLHFGWWCNAEAYCRKAKYLDTCTSRLSLVRQPAFILPLSRSKWIRACVRTCERPEVTLCGWRDVKIREVTNVHVCACARFALGREEEGSGSIRAVVCHWRE